MPKLQKHDPLRDTPATREDVTAMRNALEVSPVQVGGYLVDCGKDDEIRMRDTLSQFELLAPAGTIEWTMAGDAEVPLTKMQLQDVYDGMIQSRAVRSAKLHVKAREFKAQVGSISVRDIQAEKWMV